MPQATPNKVTSWLRVKKYSWGRNPVVGVKILDIYLRCSSRCRCPGNLPEMKSAWPPWQQAGPQWRQCSQTGVCQTHRFASEHSKTGWGRHSQKLFTGEGRHSDREYLDAVRHWKRNHTGYSPILNAQQLARETKTAKKRYWSKNWFCPGNLWKGNRSHGQKVPPADCWSQSCALASHLWRQGSANYRVRSSLDAPSARQVQVLTW